MPSTNEQKINRIINKIAKQTKPTKKEARETAIEIVNQIKKRTRLGRGVTRQINGSLTKLKPLSESYIQQRRGKLLFFTAKHGGVFTVEHIAAKELKSLRASKEASKEQKRRNKLLRDMKPKLYTETTPKRSNLTATGQLLNSIIYSIGFFNNTIIKIKFKEKRSGKTIYGDKVKSSNITNSEIVKHQRAMGREFFGLTKLEKNRIYKDLAKKIRERVRKLLS